MTEKDAGLDPMGAQRRLRIWLTISGGYIRDMRNDAAIQWVNDQMARWINQ
jgi:hypothetical protein